MAMERENRAARGAGLKRARQIALLPFVTE